MRMKKRVDWQAVLPFVVLAFAMALLEFGRNIMGDDAIYQGILLDQPDKLAAAFAFLGQRYAGWSSRLVIDFFTIFLVRVPWLWKILDTAVMVWIAVALSMFFNREKKPSVNWIIVLFILSFPMMSMSTAGWIATTMNYSWPLAASLAALMPFRWLLQGERVPRYWYPIAILLLFYATSQEQMCAIVFALCGGFVLYGIVKEKKAHWFPLIQLGLSLVGLIVIFTCPGNAIRTEKEIATWFPEFAHLSFLHKVELGYSRAMYEFVMQPNLVFTLFSGLLLLAVFMTNRKTFYRWLAAVPVTVSLVMGLFGGVLGEHLPVLTGLRNALGQTGTGLSLTSPSTWLPVLFVTAVGACVLLSLYAVFGKTPQTLLAVYLLLGGLASAWIMGFSPTVWASANRTFIFMYMSFMAVGTMLYHRLAARPLSSALKFPVAAGLAMQLVFVFNQYLSWL